MAKYRFLYILIILASAVFAFAYESKLSFVLFVSVLALPVVTLILLILSALLLKLKVEPETLYVGKQQDFIIDIKVVNRFILPVSPMMITGTFHDSAGNVISDRHLVLSANALRKSDFAFGGNIRYRGEYHLGIEHAEIYDLLRLFRIRLKNIPGCTVTVTPRRIILDDNNALCADDYDSTITNVSFMDSSSFVSVRKYEDGDLMKHVHWKLSAKHDELMVKEMEQNLGSSAIIITDIHSISADDDENMRAADAVAESALAITRKIISDGRSALNIYRTHENKVNMLTAEKNEDYEQLVSIFAVLPITETGKGAESLISTAADHLSGSEPLFIITPELDEQAFSFIIDKTSSVCGQLRIYLTGSKPSPQLIAAAEAVGNASVMYIDPDDVAVSLRNSMS